MLSSFKISVLLLLGYVCPVHVYSLMLLCCHRLLHCCLCSIAVLFVPDVQDLPSVPQHEPGASSVPVSRSRQLLEDWHHCSRCVDNYRNAECRCLAVLMTVVPYLRHTLSPVADMFSVHFDFLPLLHLLFIANYASLILPMLLVWWRERYVVFKEPVSFMPKVFCRLQCFDTVGWTAGRASGL